MNQVQSKRKQAGFTLVELMVVIAIIMILAGLLLSAVSRSVEVRKKTLAAKQISEIAVAAKNYYEVYNRYIPDTGSYGNGDTEMDQWSLHKYLGSKVTNPADNTTHEPFLIIPGTALKPPTSGDYQIYVDPWLQPYHFDAFHTLVKDVDKGDFERVGNPYDAGVIQDEQKLDFKVWSSGPDLLDNAGSHATVPPTGKDIDNITSW